MREIGFVRVGRLAIDDLFVNPKYMEDKGLVIPESLKGAKERTREAAARDSNVEAFETSEMIQVETYTPRVFYTSQLASPARCPVRLVKQLTDWSSSAPGMFVFLFVVFSFSGFLNVSSPIYTLYIWCMHMFIIVDLVWMLWRYLKPGNWTSGQIYMTDICLTPKALVFNTARMCCAKLKGWKAQVLLRFLAGVGFNCFLIFTPICGGNDPIWRAYFLNGLVQPPPSNSWCSFYPECLWMPVLRCLRMPFPCQPQG